MGKKVEEIHGQLVAFYPEYTDLGWQCDPVIYVSDFQGKYTSTIDLRQVESVKRSLAVLFFLFLLFALAPNISCPLASALGLCFPLEFSIDFL